MICIFVELLVKVDALMWASLRIRLCLNSMGKSHQGCWSRRDRTGEGPGVVAG